jgi:hypothetical protein
MADKLTVSYDEPYIDGLAKAKQIVSGLMTQTVYQQPAWLKLYHADKYIEKRQQEELADVLADPEAK